MKAVLQRVQKSTVTVGNKTIGAIGHGLMLLLGVSHDDTEKDAEYLAEKIVHLRMFEDEKGKMNNSVMDVQGEILVVSQFTLLADCRKGRRPSFVNAAAPKKADHLYSYFIEQVKKKGVQTSSGQFQAKMKVHIVNDGPVTLIIDSKIKKPA